MKNWQTFYITYHICYDANGYADTNVVIIDALPPEVNFISASGNWLQPDSSLVTGKLLSPTRKRKAVGQVEENMELSERRVCSVLEQPRMTQRYKPKQPDKNKALIAAMKRPAKKYPCYGYRSFTS